MVTVAVVSLVLWVGTPLIPVLVVLLAFAHPLAALVTIVVWVVTNRLRAPAGASPEDEVRVFDRIVAELQGGASPRSALAAVADRERVIDLSVAKRLVAAGLPTSLIAHEVGKALPHNGRLASAAWALAGEAGAPAAPVMTLLAGRAAERGRLDRERRALTAQARATAWLIAGVPMLVLAALLVMGRLSAGPGLPVVLVGVMLQVLGLAIVTVMIRRASR